MRFIRFLDSAGQIQFGMDQRDGTALRIEGDIFSNYTVTHQKITVTKLLAPLVPTLVVGFGLNYMKHAEETKAKMPEWPVLFMKSPGALQNPGDPIEIPRYLASDEVDWEGELAVVIAKRAKNVKKENALDHVLGYTCANDVSARDWQKKWGGSQWCRGKMFDTFCPLGPAIVLKDEMPNPQNSRIQTIVNGEVVQDSNTSDMIFDVASLVSFLSGSTTLLPGTVILTGTPSGVGAARTPPRFLKPGDTVTVSIEGIGELTNPVIMEPV